MQVLIIVILFFFTQTIYAQGGAFSLTPQLVELELPPGARRTIKILVMNDDTVSSRRIRCFPADFTEKPDGAYEVVDSGDTAFSAKSWLKLDTGEIFLKKGEGKEVAVDLIVPYGVKGGRYCAIVFESVPEVPKEGFYVEWKVRIPVFVEITIKTPIRVPKKAVITGIAVTEAKKIPKYREMGVSGDALVIAAKVKNEGMIHFKAQGRLIIRDKQGKRVRETPLGGGEGVVLPKAEVYFTSVIPPLKTGEYLAEAIISYGTPSPAIGRASFQVFAKGTKMRGKFEAAVPIEVTVNKELIEVLVPSKSFRTEILVFRNEGSELVRIKTEIKPAKNGVNGEILPTDSSAEKWNGKNLVTIEPDEFILESGQTKPIKVNVNLPEVEPGGKYACLLFQVFKEREKVPNQIQIPILITVRGQAEKDLEIKKIHTRGNPPYFEVLVKNTGNLHLRLRGKLVIAEPLVAKPIRDEELRPLFEISLKEDNAIILPGETIRLTGESPKKLKSKKYFGKIFLDYGEKQPFIELKEFYVY